MQGLMQHHELLTSAIVEHAARHHGATEIVSRRDDGSLARTTYAEFARRTRRLAYVLLGLGVRAGERVATLAMNSDRHLELFFAISGIGAICNTINPRLFADDIAYIAGHAEDGLIFVDPGFLPIVEEIAPALAGNLRGVIVMTDAAGMRDTALPAGTPVLCYETLIGMADDGFVWPEFDERTASALCYTSGTTGRPKGVLYSHRSTLLFAMMLNTADAVGIRAIDRVLSVAPMFHVNAWGLPFAAPMAGAALILPGRRVDADALLSLINDERASVACGVPTVWLGVLSRLRETGGTLGPLDRIMSGGSAFPRALMAQYALRGVRILHAWGMTESGPVVTWNAPKPCTAELGAEAELDQRAKQGRSMFGVDVQAQDDDLLEVPWDGTTPGNLYLRGHWVASAYYRRPDTAVGPDGWFETGDVGTIDADGYVGLTDRSKDLIKSGGEWISSIALENIAIAHPDVAEAAAIAIPDTTWGERPLLVIVPRPGSHPDPTALRAFYAGKVPKWSIPDRVVLADSIPHGATGKILKTELRRMYAASGNAEVVAQTAEGQAQPG